MGVVVIVPFLYHRVLAISCVVASVHRSKVVAHSIKIINVLFFPRRLHLILLITIIHLLIIVKFGLSRVHFYQIGGHVKLTDWEINLHIELPRSKHRVVSL